MVFKPKGKKSVTLLVSIAACFLLQPLTEVLLKVSESLKAFRSFAHRSQERCYKLNGMQVKQTEPWVG